MTLESTMFSDASPSVDATWRAPARPGAGVRKRFDETLFETRTPAPRRLYACRSLRGMGRRFQMAGLFLIEVEILDDGVVFARHRSLPVFGYGDSEREAVAALGDMFALQWATLVEGEGEMTEGAAAVAARLRQCVSGR